MSNQQARLVVLLTHSYDWSYRLPQDVKMTENVTDQTVKADLCDHYHNVSFFVFLLSPGLVVQYVLSPLIQLSLLSQMTTLLSPSC